MDIRMTVTQNQILSQKMIQSTEILQMSSQELEQYIKELAVENPVMDIEDTYEQPDSQSDLAKKLEWLASLDDQNRVYYRQEYGNSVEKQSYQDYQPELPEALSEYLLYQLLTMRLGQKAHDIINYIVYSLDSKGYFTEDIKETAKRFDTRPSFVEKQLKLLQTLEPAGICARNLKECLLLQLERQGIDDDIAHTIISEYLELLGKNQLHVIAKKMHLILEDIKKSCETIKNLNPKPGSRFDSRGGLKYITPDVTVVKLSGYYEILLNEYTYPKIGINHYYKQMLQLESSQETVDYISKKIRQAEWIKTCITQRNSTLMRVAKCLVDYQSEFFGKGNDYLRPLRLQDVAEKLDIHESTVSRAVRDKYLQCPWGIFPMNYFFSKGIPVGDKTEKITTDSIKRRLVRIVEMEDKKKPWSDRIIMEKLLEQDIKISRRTVTKYREDLGIKDASGRKIFD